MIDSYAFDYAFPLIVMWLALAVVGGVVAFYAIKSYRSTRAPSMAVFAGGLVVLSVGSSASWFMMWFSGYNMVWCGAIAVGTATIGFGAILLGLRSRLA